MSTLTTADLKSFARLGIVAALLALAEIVRVTDREAREQFGIRGSGDMAGIIFPYLDPRTGSRTTARLRRDNPEIEAGKIIGKYILAYGDRRHLYFPPGSADLLADQSVPIIFVEAEKSSLALTAFAQRVGRKYLAVAMGGCWGWRGRIGKVENERGERVDEKGPLPDLNICREGRLTYVLLDANVRTNPAVQAARRDLVRQLRKQGADVRVLDLPAGDWNGPDDYIAVAGDEAMLALIESGGTATDGGDIVAPLLSEDDLAGRFSERYEDQLRYVSELGQWMRYVAGRWQPERTLLAFEFSKLTCREASAECGDSEKATRLRLASKATHAAVERLAQSDRRHAATIEQWDRDPWLLNTPAGTVVLTTNELRPHSRADYITKSTACAPGGECPLWRKFLERVTGGDSKLQAFLQRVIGYSLTGSTREHALFFLYGTGANGKSVFLGTVSTLLADYAKTAPASTFTANAQEQHPTDLASLRGARLVVASEVDDGARWNEPRVKSLTGGDKIAARFMRGNFFEFTPDFKLLISGNHKPSLRTVDEAIRRRLHLIPFTVTIPEVERDLELTEKLRAEFPGILQWAIEGCLAWQRDGLKPPDCVRSATAAYMAGEDRLGAWLDDCCLIDRRCWSENSALFQSFTGWCQRAGERECSQRRFSQALEARGFQPERTGRARGFSGIGLRDDLSGEIGAEETGDDACDTSDHYRRTGARTHTSITGASVTSVTKGKTGVQ